MWIKYVFWQEISNREREKLVSHILIMCDRCTHYNQVTSSVYRDYLTYINRAWVHREHKTYRQYLSKRYREHFTMGVGEVSVCKCANDGVNLSIWPHVTMCLWFETKMKLGLDHAGTHSAPLKDLLHLERVANQRKTHKTPKQNTAPNTKRLWPASPVTLEFNPPWITLAWMAEHLHRNLASKS